MTKYYYPKKRKDGSFVAITKYQGRGRGAMGGQRATWHVIAYKRGKVILNRMSRKKPTAIKLKDKYLKKL